jgi:DNA-directed RNA polymerase specialized sigma24 family protein
MDRQQFEMWQNRAKNMAARWGYRCCAEDFAQEVCLAISKGRKASMKQMFIDFLRREYGDYRFAGGDKKAASVRMLASPLAIERLSKEYGRPAIEMAKSLRYIERSLVILHYDWGFTVEEIAHCFGVGEPRIRKRLERLLDKLARPYPSRRNSSKIQ